MRRWISARSSKTPQACQTSALAARATIRRALLDPPWCDVLRYQTGLSRPNAVCVMAGALDELDQAHRYRACGPVVITKAS